MFQTMRCRHSGVLPSSPPCCWSAKQPGGQRLPCAFNITKEAQAQSKQAEGSLPRGQIQATTRGGHDGAHDSRISQRRGGGLLKKLSVSRMPKDTQEVQ